ncbi:heat shock factor 2-binding protein isoform X4 [Anas acuta]|uniref:heat shock factor 2-binding protein isoform X4 n=1 Tax=Anas acuta TaxID=28680 RepID=UPI0035C93218
MKRSNMVSFRPEWQKLDYSRRVSIPESCFKLLLASSFLKSGYEFLKCCDTEQSFCLREKEYCRAVVVSLLLVGGFLWCSVGMVFVCVLSLLFVCLFFSQFQKAETKEDFVKVRRSDLERLTTEVMQLRDFLPKILNGDILWTFQKLDAVESSMEKKEEELEQLKMDCEHFRARLEAAQADCMREKKEKLDLRQHLHEAKQQLLQQAEYCTEMGAAVCTLLWGVSSNEEAVKTILGGSKAAKFFTITAQTMESFVKSLSEDMKQQDLDSDENQFVLALAGIVTNVAALACGREFLVTSSRELLDTMVHLLGDMKPGLCTKFKVLMLMSLYNVSINLKGLKYISESPGFIPLLWWLLNA